MELCIGGVQGKVRLIGTAGEREGEEEKWKELSIELCLGQASGQVLYIPYLSYPENSSEIGSVALILHIADKEINVPQGLVIS